MAALGAALLLAGLQQPIFAQPTLARTRTPIHIPDLPGYVTLKCDFHIHTVFSDGLVWPTVRVEEAWREGLDAIAITDHIEYQRHREDVSTNHNRSYEIASRVAPDLDILVVSGAEITRPMPPGHINALFLTNPAALAVEDWREAVAAARQQGAFLSWNHPAWEPQLKNGKALWYPEHEKLLRDGMLHGVEVVNGGDYYRDAHVWALQNKLVIGANSDMHSPLGFDYDVPGGVHRTLTLVFSKERSVPALREALFAGRTVALAGHQLIGDMQYLHPLFNRAVQFGQPRFSRHEKQRVFVHLHNRSDIEFVLERTADVPGFTIPKKITLAPQRTTLLTLAQTSIGNDAHMISLPWRVLNLVPAPDQYLPVTVELHLPSKEDARN